MTGYIDVTGVLEPKISRDDFQPNELTKALFQTLKSMEDEIKGFITGQLNTPTSKEYKNLEEFLSNTLKKLNENKKFRSLINFETGSRNKIKKEESENPLFDIITLTVPKRINRDDGKITPDNGGNGNNSEKITPDNSRGSTLSEIRNQEIVMREIDVKLRSSAIDTTQSESDKSNRKKSGINSLSIIIDCDNDPPLDSNDLMLRSSMINNQIIIYKKHPMFEERTKGNFLGVQTISHEQILHISVEIITQVEILVYNENKDAIDDISAFFHKYSEGVYLFVGELTKLAGKNLSEVTNLNL